MTPNNPPNIIRNKSAARDDVTEMKCEMRIQGGQEGGDLTFVNDFDQDDWPSRKNEMIPVQHPQTALFDETGGEIGDRDDREPI